MCEPQELTDDYALYLSFQYEVMDLLTAVQLGKLVVISNLLTNGAQVSAEVDAATLMRVLGGRNISELQSFLHELNKLAAEVRKFLGLWILALRDYSCCSFATLGPFTLLLMALKRVPIQIRP